MTSDEREGSLGLPSTLPLLERLDRRHQRVACFLLEYSQLHKKPYNLFVCDFGNVLRDAGVHANPT